MIWLSGTLPVDRRVARVEYAGQLVVASPFSRASRPAALALAKPGIVTHRRRLRELPSRRLPRASRQAA